jgi:hypothetical protein
MDKMSTTDKTEELLAAVHRLVEEHKAKYPPEVNRVVDIFRGRIGSAGPAKRCPFCGGLAVIIWGGKRDASTHHFWGAASVGCDVAGCRGAMPFGLPPLADFEKEMERWNRRTKNKGAPTCYTSHSP